MKFERNLVNQYEILAQIIPLIKNVNVVPVDVVNEEIEKSSKVALEEIKKISKKIDDIIFYVEPGLCEELTLHIGAISSVGGGVEYTLTIPLQGLSYPEVKEDLEEIAGKRINQLSKSPKRIAKIVEEYLQVNKLYDLLNKLS
jgi:hypothetical protein